MAFVISFHSAANSSGRSRLRTASDGMVKMMLSNSSSAQGEGAVRSRDHSSWVVTPERTRKLKFCKIYCKLLVLIIKECHTCWHTRDTYQTYNMVQVQQFARRPPARPLLFCLARSHRSARPTGCTPASSRKSPEIADGHMALSSVQTPWGGLFDNQFGSEEGKTHKSHLEK